MRKGREENVFVRKEGEEKIINFELFHSDRTKNLRERKYFILFGWRTGKEK